MQTLADLVDQRVRGVQRAPRPHHPTRLPSSPPCRSPMSSPAARKSSHASVAGAPSCAGRCATNRAAFAPSSTARSRHEHRSFPICRRADVHHRSRRSFLGGSTPLADRRSCTRSRYGGASAAVASSRSDGSMVDPTPTAEEHVEVHEAVTKDDRTQRESLRRRLREKRAALAEGIVRAMSAEVCATIAALPAFARAQSRRPLRAGARRDRSDAAARSAPRAWRRGRLPAGRFDDAGAARLRTRRSRRDRWSPVASASPSRAPTAPSPTTTSTSSWSPASPSDATATGSVSATATTTVRSPPRRTPCASGCATSSSWSIACRRVPATSRSISSITPRERVATGARPLAPEEVPS